MKEAYKAYGPQMNTYITDAFIDNLPDRFCIIDTWDEGLYNEFFNNDKYQIVECKKFKTDYYEEYEYNIKLLEKVKK